MGSVLVLGDTHIWNHKWQGGPLVDGINRRCRDILESILTTVHSAIKDHNVTTAVQLGDFFDGPRPSAAVIDAAIRMIKESGVEWHIIAGNHDIASYDAPTAVAPLGHVEGVHVYERPTQVTVEGSKWAMVPYTGPKAADALAAAAPVFDKAVYAAVHYGFTYGPPDRPDLIGADQWANLVRQSRAASYGYFGHEHSSRTRSGHGISLGAYTSSNFSDLDYVPLVAIVEDDSSITYRTCGPRFLSVAGEGLQLDLPRLVNSVWSRQHTLGFPTYLYIDEDQESAARVLLDAGIIQGFKIQTPLYSTGPAYTYNHGTYVSSPMDVVYTTAGVSVPEHHLEDVVSILEQDMQE